MDVSSSLEMSDAANINKVLNNNELKTLAPKTSSSTSGKAAAAVAGAGATASNTAAKAVKNKITNHAGKLKKSIQDALAVNIIEPSNKGFQLMQKMGYEKGTGLGKNNDGIMEPIPLHWQVKRMGLGAEEAATKPLSRKQRKRLRKQIAATTSVVVKNPRPKPLTKKQRKRLRQETEAMRRLVVNVGTPLEQRKVKKRRCKKSKPLPMQLGEDENNNNSYNNNIVQQQPNICCAENTVQIQTKKRPHSPIRAPTPSPTSSTRCRRAPSPMPVLATKSKPMLLRRPQFSLTVPSTPEQLQEITKYLGDAIELLHYRLADEAMRHEPDELDFIEAEIKIHNGQQIADHTYEFVRTELVGWIGKYQHLNLKTPIFHNMINNGSHITIICQANYAYNCLQQCIDEIFHMRTLGHIQVVRLPPLSNWLYYFHTIYSSIIADPSLLLTQIELHTADLKANRWIVVAHEVRIQERNTLLMLLIDEPSAMALTYRHKSKLFICMQTVELTYCGRLPVDLPSV